MRSLRKEMGRLLNLNPALSPRSLPLAVLPLLLSACAIPTTVGPTYSPSYPESSENVWTHGQFKVAEPNPRTIVMRQMGCFIRLKAYPQQPDLNIQLTVEDGHRKGVAPCTLRMADGPIIVEDPDTGEMHKIRIIQRDFPFLLGPGVDIHRTVNPARLFPGFEQVPGDKRHYALGLEFRRVFDGPLPSSSTIRLPDIELGEQRISLPPITIERYERSGSGWWYVVTNSQEKIRPTEKAGMALGGGAQVFKPADVWFENPELKSSAVFRGTPYTYDENFKKNNQNSMITGTIYFRIKGSWSFHLTQPEVQWLAPGEMQGKRIAERSGVLNIRRFTTTQLSARIEGLPRSIKPDRTLIHEDHDRTFLVTVPNFHPKRFRLFLPAVTTNGTPWPIQPITFTYHSGGVGLTTWP